MQQSVRFPFIRRITFIVSVFFVELFSPALVAFDSPAVTMELTVKS